MKRICFFCKKRKEYTEVYLGNIRDKFYSICYLCNKVGVHFTLEEKWQKNVGNGWIYDYEKDKYFNESMEFGRLMLFYLLLDPMINLSF